MSTHFNPPQSPPPGHAGTGSEDSSSTEPQMDQLVSDIKDYQLTHGNLLKLVRLEEATRIPSIGVGVSALPTPFPRRCFDEAWQLQRCMNELYIRAAADEPWLYAILKPLIEHDSFLAALWSVHLEVKEAGAVQSVVCGIFRADYMLHQPVASESVSLKQVELNTFSAAGGCHAEHVAGMHRHFERVRVERNQTSLQDIGKLASPGNNINAIVSALAAAHRAYQPSSSKGYCILMVVQPLNFNVADERPIEYGLWDADIPCYRCEWQEVLSRTTLTVDRKLMYRPIGSSTEFEVSVVYYRAGYDAAEYDEQGEETRLRLELSRAINCPDVLTHLTTFKAVQQALTESAALERFLTSADAGRVRSTFMPMYTLNSSPVRLHARAIAMDAAQAVHYVLKPNLEGGGNNVYGSNIPGFLAGIPAEQWSQYILMRLIEPPKDTHGELLTADELYQGPVVSELGVFGAVMWRKKDGDGEVEILRNEAAGWTFKTKPADTDEMSVVKGYGCFDCPRLTD
ncbi:hypothetical protein LTR85_009837 [Meristemomyces frigidus]|nr:hypothetical protein LTR85_009837 [Meristemomyces frigidus]